MIGTVLSDTYEVVEKLGEGAMGAVYAARHTRTGREVAVKVVTGDAAEDKEGLERFEREARSAGAVETRHIAKVIDIATDEATDCTYLVMERLRGEDLFELVQRVGALRPKLVLALAAQACLGLQKAHEAGIVHRDVKLANIFVAEGDDDEYVAKILDFGIAKLRGPMANDSRELTKTGDILGSPLYLSPEQAVGHRTIDHRSDIFSLGVVSYYALCGRAPFAHCETLGELLLSICSLKPPPIQEISPWVDDEIVAVVDRCMAQDPADRYQTANELLGALKELLPGGYRITNDEPFGVEGETSEPNVSPLKLSEVGAAVSDRQPAEGSDDSTDANDGETDADDNAAESSTRDGRNADLGNEGTVLAETEAVSEPAKPNRSWFWAAALVLGVGLIWFQLRSNATVDTEAPPSPVPNASQTTSNTATAPQPGQASSVDSQTPSASPTAEASAQPTAAPSPTTVTSTAAQTSPPASRPLRPPARPVPAPSPPAAPAHEEIPAFPSEQ